VGGCRGAMVHPVVTQCFVQPVLAPSRGYTQRGAGSIVLPVRRPNTGRVTQVRSLSPPPTRGGSRPSSFVAAPPPVTRPRKEGRSASRGRNESYTAYADKFPSNQEMMEDYKPELVVAIDVDEVLVCYVDGFRKFLQRELPEGLPESSSIFKEAHDANSPWRMKFAMEGGLENLEAVPGSHEALRRLCAAGLRLEVVTSRPPAMKESTKVLLGKLFPPDTFADYHFVQGGEKGLTCVQLGALALVDDQIPNAIDVLNCGLLPILFDLNGSYPWSVCGPQDLPLGVHRIETWAQTADFLLAKAENHRNVMSAAKRALTPTPPLTPRALTKVPVILAPVHSDEPYLATARLSVAAHPLAAQSESAMCTANRNGQNPQTGGNAGFHTHGMIARPTRKQALGQSDKFRQVDDDSRSSNKLPVSPSAYPPSAYPEVKKYHMPEGRPEGDKETPPSNYLFSLSHQDPEPSLPRPRSAVRERTNESLRSSNRRVPRMNFAEVPTDKMPQRTPPSPGSPRSPSIATMDQASLWGAGDDLLAPTFDRYEPKAKDADDAGPPMPMSMYHEMYHEDPKKNGEEDPCTIQ